MKNLIQTIKGLVTRKSKPRQYHFIGFSDKGKPQAVMVTDKDEIKAYDRAYECIASQAKSARKMKPARLQELAGISKKK